MADNSQLIKEVDNEKSSKRKRNKSDFRFAATRVHLTYKHWLNVEQLIAYLECLGGESLWWSICHESPEHGDAPDSIPYQHTHVAICWRKRVDTTNQRFFDVVRSPTPAESGVYDIGEAGRRESNSELIIHPHIAKISSDKHALHLFTEYHRKENNFKQSESGPGTGSLFDRIRDACSLAEACDLAGVAPRSVPDVVAIRNDRPTPGPHVHLWPDAEWTLQVPDGWRVLFLSGKTGTGKTQWSVHQFRAPLIVSQWDDLKTFDRRRHDGIVFDDISFGNLEREHAIAITDWEVDRSIKCRFTNAFIPAKTRKIFCTNQTFEEYFPYDPHNAIRRRISKIINVQGPTFKKRRTEAIDVAPVRGLEEAEYGTPKASPEIMNFGERYDQDFADDEELNEWLCN